MRRLMVFLLILGMIFIIVPVFSLGAFWISPIGGGNNHSDPTTLGNNSYTSASEISTMTANQTLAASRVCYVSSVGKLLYADNTANSTANAMCLTTGAITTQVKGTVLLRGFYRENGWTFTAGNLLWLSTSGNVTDVEPSGSGDQVINVGRAISEDIGYFYFDSTWVAVP